VKKLLAGLCALVFLVFLVGSGVALARHKKASVWAETVAAQCPGPFTLSVGYADTDVPDAHLLGPNAIPVPWLGDGCGPGTNCQFLGALQLNGTWDAGAIWIVNTGTDPLRVVSVTVDIGSALDINPWTVAPLSLPATIPASGSLILTETSSNPNDTEDNFDTSDLPAYTCIPDGDIPEIHVTVSAVPSASNPTPIQVIRNFADTGQVLNTGGFDSGNCPSIGTGKNEGQPFVLLTEEKNTCCSLF
jgi:hypothetical protein